MTTNDTVDALAAIDTARECLDFSNSARDIRAGMALKEARAAVAELVEADREYDRLRWAPYDRHDPVAAREAREQFIAAQDRRAAALARIGGAP